MECVEGNTDKGTDGASKSDGFSEKFQTAFDPPSFSENYVANVL